MLIVWREFESQQTHILFFCVVLVRVSVCTLSDTLFYLHFFSPPLFCIAPAVVQISRTYYELRVTLLLLFDIVGRMTRFVLWFIAPDSSFGFSVFKLGLFFNVPLGSAVA